MSLVNAARDAIAAFIIGSGPTPFDATNAYIAVGDSSAAFSVSQTNLQAVSNVFRKGMDVGFPQRSGNILTFQATFETDEANFDWNEWGVANAISGGTLLNRKVSFIGTKTSDQIWEFNVEIVLTLS